jgi:hypothetical protein
VVEVTVFAEANMVVDMVAGMVASRGSGYEDHTVVIRAWFVERTIRSEKVQKTDVDIVGLP